MPGWHAKTLQLQQQGRIQMAGIIEEQHPDRARLFMQWKAMDWPILVDSLNLLGVTVVPLTLLIDEEGIIHSIQPDDRDFEDFLQGESSVAGDSEKPSPALDVEALATSAKGGNEQALLDYGDALYLWEGQNRLDEVISLYQKAERLGPDHGPVHFRLGVAYRSRYDSDLRKEGDFANAVKYWGRALEIDPNQYIWRRRIQQYGPRLEKPYPFYDWVHQARKEIGARGEIPSPLAVEPGGAEFSSPAAEFSELIQSGPQGEPDPGGRILRDKEGMIAIEIVTVPARVEAGKSARIHLLLIPDTDRKAHWNNEVEGLKVWLHPPPGWQVDRRLNQLPNPPQAVSQEVREVEFEIQTPQGRHGSAVLPGYALYYVCEDVNGTCLYRRQDFEVRLLVEPPR